MWHNFINHIHHSFAWASAVTYGGTLATMTTWGLNMGEVPVIISCSASVVGISLQCYLTLLKIKEIKQSDEDKKD